MQPAHLRPLSAGEILDRAFSLYRAHLAVLLGTAVTAMAPLLLMQTLWALGMPLLGPWADLVLQLATVVLGYASLTYVAGRLYMGHGTTVAEGLWQGGARIVPLSAAFLLMMIGIGLGFLGLVIGAVIVWVLLFAIVPVVVLERGGPLTAIRRSVSLAEGDALRIFAILTVAYVIASLPSAAVQFSMSMSGNGGPNQSALAGALALLVSALTYPFSIAVTVILYYDRRVRMEGLDMQLAAGLVNA